MPALLAFALLWMQFLGQSHAFEHGTYRTSSVVEQSLKSSHSSTASHNCLSFDGVAQASLALAKTFGFFVQPNRWTVPIYLPSLYLALSYTGIYDSRVPPKTI